MMNFLQAFELMKQGASVQSLVSMTLYEATPSSLFAEGLPVPNEYLTVEEANGEWEEVWLVETMDEFESLSAEEKSDIINEGIINFEFNEMHNR